MAAKSKYSTEDKAVMAARYVAGSTLKELADIYEVTIPTMAKYVRAGGGDVRKQGVRPKVKSPVLHALNEEIPVVPTAEAPVVVEGSGRQILAFE